MKTLTFAGGGDEDATEQRRATGGTGGDAKLAAPGARPQAQFLHLLQARSVGRKGQPRDEARLTHDRCGYLRYRHLFDVKYRSREKVEIIVAVSHGKRDDKTHGRFDL